MLLETVARNASADATTDLVDGGVMRLKTSGGTLLSSHTLATPSFGSAVAGVATANTIGSDTDADATGDAASGEFYKADGATLVWTGTVGTADADIIMPTVAIQQHATVVPGVVTYTQPAS